MAKLVLKVQMLPLFQCLHKLCRLKNKWKRPIKICQKPLVKYLHRMKADNMFLILTLLKKIKKNSLWLLLIISKRKKTLTSIELLILQIILLLKEILMWVLLVPQVQVWPQVWLVVCLLLVVCILLMVNLLMSLPKVQMPAVV